MNKSQSQSSHAPGHIDWEDCGDLVRPAKHRAEWYVIVPRNAKRTALFH